MTAKKIHYLVQRDYLNVPLITRREIWDKSKADLFAKLVASFQAVWLVAQIIARAIQRLPVTLIEVSTVALITCAAFTIFFWFQKPLNVETPTLLEIGGTIAEILVDAGSKAEIPFEDTPLDFIEPRIYTSSQLPSGRDHYRDSRTIETRGFIVCTPSLL